MYAGSLPDKQDQLRVLQLVMDVSPFTPGDQDAGFTQGHQVLGKICLPPVECGLEMAYTGIPLANCQKDE